MAECPEEVYKDAVEKFDKSNDDDLSSAIDFIYDALLMFLANNFEGAKKKLEPRSTVRFYDALGYATVNYLQAVITMDSTQIQDATVAIKNCLEICDKYRKKISFTNSFKFKNKRQIEYHKYTDEECHAELCYAEALLQKAFLTFLRDENLISLIRGSLKIKECYNTYKACWHMLAMKSWQSEKSKAAFESGTRLGVGAFNLMISMLPSRVMKLLEFVGFKGNKKFGLAQLDKAARYDNSLRQPMAQLMLLGYHCFVGVALGLYPYQDHINEAKVHLDSCLEKYPSSAIFEMFRGRFDLIRGDFEGSIVGYETSIAAQSEWKNLHDICYWELLWSYALQSDWLMAMKYAEKLSQHSKWSKALYLYQRAVFLIECYAESKEVMNTETQNLLIRLFQTIPTVTQRIAGKSLPAEKFAVKRCKRFAAQNNKLVLPGIELLFIWNGFKIVGHSPEHCRKLLAACELQYTTFMKENTESSEFYYDNLSLILMLKSVGLLYSGEASKAEELMLELLNYRSKVKEDTYIFPYTEVELATLYFQKEKYDDATYHARRALNSYKSYSLESRLHFRIHEINALIKQATKLSRSSSSQMSWIEQSNTVNDTNNNHSCPNDGDSDTFLDCQDEDSIDEELNDAFNELKLKRDDNYDKDNEKFDEIVN